MRRDLAIVTKKLVVLPEGRKTKTVRRDEIIGLPSHKKTNEHLWNPELYQKSTHLRSNLAIHIFYVMYS